jgi:hypothetical protein
MPWDLCFVKIFFGSSEGFTHFVEWDNFWVNILRDIDIYFIPFVHANYLVFFFQRLKHAAHGWVSCSCSPGGAASYSSTSGQDGETRR